MRIKDTFCCQQQQAAIEQMKSTPEYQLEVVFDKGEPAQVKFSPGDSITGVLRLHVQYGELPFAQLMVKLLGTATTDVTTSAPGLFNFQHINDSQTEVLVSQNIVVAEGAFPPGARGYKFALKIPETPPSAAFQSQSVSAVVQYTFKAVVRLAGTHSQETWPVNVVGKGPTKEEFEKIKPAGVLSATKILMLPLMYTPPPLTYREQLMGSQKPQKSSLGNFPHLTTTTPVKVRMEFDGKPMLIPGKNQLKIVLDTSANADGTDPLIVYIQCVTATLVSQIQATTSKNSEQFTTEQIIYKSTQVREIDLIQSVPYTLSQNKNVFNSEIDVSFLLDTLHLNNPTPDFKTSNIELTHQLRLELKVSASPNWLYGQATLTAWKSVFVVGPLIEPEVITAHLRSRPQIWEPESDSELETELETGQSEVPSPDAPGSPASAITVVEDAAEILSL